MTWPVDLPARSGALWWISAMGSLANLSLGLAVMLGSPSPCWLSDLYGIVQIQMSPLQSVDCDSFCLSYNVKLECLGARLNYPEGAFIRLLTLPEIPWHLGKL